MQFTSELELAGKTATGFRVPDNVVEGLGGGKHPKVTATVGGFTFRSSIARMGDAYWLGVSADRRAEAGIAAGETHTVEVALDTAPREIDLPDSLAAALSAAPEAAAFWGTLSFSNKRWHVEQVTSAKTEETRDRRIARSIDLLGQGRAR